MISHIHATTIVVSDQDTSLNFYVNVLGWEKADDAQMGPEMRWLTVAPPGAKTQLVLGHSSWVGGGRTVGGHTGIALAASDIEATVAALTERGVRFKGPIEVMPWGGKGVWFFDLDGKF